jgi:hypothetical protein
LPIIKHADKIVHVAIVKIFQEMMILSKKLKVMSRKKDCTIVVSSKKDVIVKNLSVKKNIVNVSMLESHVRMPVNVWIVQIRIYKEAIKTSVKLRKNRQNTIIQIYSINRCWQIYNIYKTCES